MAKWDQDFGYFGKGLDGYVQYMETFNEVNKKNEPPAPDCDREPADEDFAAPPQSAARKTAAQKPELSPEERARVDSWFAAQEKKDRRDTIKSVLFFIGFFLLLVFLFHDV